MSKRYEFIGASVCITRSANTSSKALLSFNQVTFPGFSLYCISKWAGSPAIEMDERQIKIAEREKKDKDSILNGEFTLDGNAGYLYGTLALLHYYCYISLYIFLLISYI